jgi:hypothetical protein
MNHQALVRREQDRQLRLQTAGTAADVAVKFLTVAQGVAQLVQSVKAPGTENQDNNRPSHGPVSRVQDHDDRYANDDERSPIERVRIVYRPRRNSTQIFLVDNRQSKIILQQPMMISRTNSFADNRGCYRGCYHGCHHHSGRPRRRHSRSYWYASSEESSYYYRYSRRVEE